MLTIVINTVVVLVRLFKLNDYFLYRLPENVSYDEGAVVEPLSVVVYACERAEVTVDSKVLICGAGQSVYGSLLTVLL